ncbi:mechanosensitive ion channel protein 1, mitochondrial [Brachypodium distachyon]|uniref:mechanosensitive ion channel protein 1, mitochondrial n=1 Tax=Brachypodium distachyon TaxID=15368 RepID=UPI000D0DCC06|nr:mechanosensitive ion channel protein 1, mitochondrial [Brachypodium distachyon]|eukprot:XP_014752118.2 mechanosensitive ion channel protein 1, mitochondrial [Brachypodium distachyon]
MVDYPTSANFLMNLPAYAVKEVMLMKISRSVFGAGKFCRPFLGAARENILESVGLHVSDRLSAAWTSSCGESIKPTTFSQIKAEQPRFTPLPSVFAVLSMHRPYSSDAGVNSDVPQIIAQDSTTSTEISKFSAAADVATDMVDYITLTHPALLTYAIKAGVLLVLAKTGVVAPNMGVYIPIAWHSVTTLSLLWFLHTFKRNFICIAGKEGNLIGKEWISLLIRFFQLDSWLLDCLVAEAAGVSVESLLTVSGAGGVVTAFAARDVLGNMLCGFSLQLSGMFSVEEYIKAGVVEGMALNIGLTSTSLMSRVTLPITVPNSSSNQIITNISRAQSRACIIKIPIRTEDIVKIHALSDAIKNVLRSIPDILLKTDSPYCYISRLGNSYGELIIGCDIRTLGNDNFLLIEKYILLKAATVIKSHGIALGDPLPCADLKIILEATNRLF